MKKVLVFDFDGTIADTFPEFVRLINPLAEKYKFKKITEEDIKRLRDYDTVKILQALKIPLWKLPFIIREGKELLHQAIETIEPIAGMKQVLVELHQKGFTLGILTSNTEKTVRKFLKKHNMELFDFIYTGSNIFGKDKVMRAMVKEKKFVSDEVWYVGDETRDIEAAKKIKITMIAVTWGFISRKGLEKYKPDFLIDHPEELLKIATR